MAYSYDVALQLSAVAEDQTIVTDHKYSLDSVDSDYTVTNVLLIPANSEIGIQLAGINRLQAVFISSDQVFDVALSSVDNAGVTEWVYSGVFGNTYYRQFSSPVVFDGLHVKAGTVDTVVKVSCVGLENL